MRKLLALYLAITTGCASNPAHPSDPSDPAPAPPTEPVQARRVIGAIVDGSKLSHAAVDATYAALGNPPYMRGIKSVTVMKTSVVRAQPRADSDPIGVIRKGTRAGLQQAVPGGNGCSPDLRWIELAPRGWLCESMVEPSTDAPTPAIAAGFGDDDADGSSLGVFACAGAFLHF